MSSEGEFINDNFYEYAETRKTAALAFYGFDSGIGLTGYLFNSDVDTRENDHELDAGAALSYEWQDAKYFAGIGYLSDLSEVLEPLEEIERDTVLPRTPVLSGQFYVTEETWRIMLEHIASVDELSTAEAGFRRPRATSLEAFVKSDKRWLTGIRYQFTKELEDVPEQEYGVTARFWFEETLSIGIEYVYGKFARGYIDDDDNQIRDINTVTMEVTVEF